MDENFKKIATKLLKDEDINYDEFEKIIDLSSNNIGNLPLEVDSFWLNLIKHYVKKHDISLIIQYILKYIKKGNDLSREYIEELFDVSEAEEPILDLGLRIFLVIRYPEQFSIDEKILYCEILLSKEEDFELPMFMPFISSILIQNERGKDIFKENIKYFREQVRFGDEEQQVAARNVLKSIPKEYLSLLNKE
jgi:hypothetical protein